jgi:hypothetical protein
MKYGNSWYILMNHCNHNKWTLKASIMSNLTRLKIGVDHNKNNDFHVNQNEPSQLFVHSWPWLYNKWSCNTINIKLMVFFIVIYIHIDMMIP